MAWQETISVRLSCHIPSFIHFAYKSLKLCTSKSSIYGVGYGYIRRKLSEHAGPYALSFRALVPLRVKQAKAGFRRI